MAKIYFHVVPPFDLFWSVKYRIIYITKIHITKSRLLKNPYHVLFPKESLKMVSAHGLIPVCRGVYILYFKINPPIFSPLF